MHSQNYGYYGQLNNELKGENLVSHILDDTWERILHKHEAQLISTQDNIIKKLKETFKDEVKCFTKSISEINKRLIKLENLFPNKEIDKDDKDAVDKGKESKNKKRF